MKPKLPEFNIEEIELTEEEAIKEEEAKRYTLEDYKKSNFFEEIRRNCRSSKDMKRLYPKEYWIMYRMNMLPVYFPDDFSNPKLKYGNIAPLPEIEREKFLAEYYKSGIMSPKRDRLVRWARNSYKNDKAKYNTKARRYKITSKIKIKKSKQELVDQAKNYENRDEMLKAIPDLDAKMYAYSISERELVFRDEVILAEHVLNLMSRLPSEQIEIIYTWIIKNHRL